MFPLKVSETPPDAYGPVGRVVWFEDGVGEIIPPLPVEFDVVVASDTVSPRLPAEVPAAGKIVEFAGRLISAELVCDPYPPLPPVEFDVAVDEEVTKVATPEVRDGPSDPTRPVELEVAVALETGMTKEPLVGDGVTTPESPVELNVAVPPETVRAAEP